MNSTSHKLNVLEVDHLKHDLVIAESRLAQAQIDVERAQIMLADKEERIDLATPSDVKAADVKAARDPSGGNLKEAVNKLKEEAKVKVKRKAAQAKNEDDIAKVRAAAAKATKGKEATLLYTEGKVNMLGYLSPLRHLSTERRAVYLCDVELDKTKHTQALEHGVMDLDMVNEVIGSMSTEAVKVEGTPRITKDIVINLVGDKLLEHMAQRVGKDTLKLDVTDLFKALKVG